MKNLPVHFHLSYSQKAIIALIKAYQKIFSPDHGLCAEVSGVSRCRFYPSCSAYAEAAFRQYGFFGACVASCGRIARCHPWSRGGFDPVRNRTRTP